MIVIILSGRKPIIIMKRTAEFFTILLRKKNPIDDYHESSHDSVKIS